MRLTPEEQAEDVAFEEWCKNGPGGPHLEIAITRRAWHERARRARDTEKILRDARDEWREAYLREEADNKRLRELLRRWTEGVLCSGDLMEKSRVALEGKNEH